MNPITADGIIMGCHTHKAHLWFIVFVQQDILQFQISVSDSTIMTVFDTLQNLPKHLLGITLRDPFLESDILKQFTSGDVFHRNAKVLLCFKRYQKKRKKSKQS